MTSSTTIIFVLMISSFFVATINAESLSMDPDLFLKALIKTFQTPISSGGDNAQLSVDIILANDVFNLDDVLRLFIQQYLLALYNNRYHLMPSDWETEYPAYSKIITEVNNILDLMGRRKLSEISVKDIRPLIKSLTPMAFKDLRRILKTLDDRAKEEEEKEEEEEATKAASSNDDEL
ncbi:unnamed protein product [Rotaria socialis]|uniref:Uncharacterized protein n=2 Tax=Rotaria socialis TaxID=392032 RepID=A0A820MDY7_9BILA|nr:unnamed protein product [Rotaria socialis]CAF3616951.1 unnamed protein product [Rotaria socialis]CAF4091468.1 unnamed protein product [Rotaria socialis]CAF4312316.1 unnamed protein product [Rotaria socialis]CAF4371552.1 unnamed protein product [Rotaria socialis]